MQTKQIEKLAAKGVRIPNPETVYISEDVDPDRISGNGVVLYGGTKLIGPKTLIMDNTVIGYEAPVTLENTLVGPESRLNGGFFQGAVFLGRNSFGSGGHARAGTILEEEANAAHTVGLKQTILFPFVTLGSLINFCDCLMAGGTSRKDHSEVGSSFIHFNYTPNQDKATPSIFGNVCQGVMLKEPPVFLGGQGGVVGPVRLAFGSVSAAGSVVRKSEETPNRLILGGGLKSMSLARQPGVYTQVRNIFDLNLSYIAELMALRAWYAFVRPLFASNPFGSDPLQSNALQKQLIIGLQENLDNCIQERIKRLAALKEKLEFSKERITAASKGGGKEAVKDHDAVLSALEDAEEIFDGLMVSDSLGRTAEPFFREVEQNIGERGPDYLSVIRNLSEKAVGQGTQWLSGIAGDVIGAFERQSD